ncbi:MAG: DUF4830 domain-containing protein [Alistipes sp.]|nr:DUF4830 domain-containing protein [Alistipes sp.]
MSKKFFLGFVTAAIIISGVILIFPENKTDPIPSSSPVNASDADSRVSYFASHGWDVEEISSKDITIPSDFSESYEAYAVIQDKQGLPLREYAGKSAKIYVYKVNNYSPDNKKMLAELLVCDDTAVASLVYGESDGDLRLSVS